VTRKHCDSDRSAVESCRIQNSKGEFGHFRSAEERADSSDRLATYDLLLVFDGDVRFA